MCFFFRWNLQGLSGLDSFEWARLGFIGFYGVILGLTGFYRFLPSLHSSEGMPGILVSKVEEVLPGFTSEWRGAAWHCWVGVSGAGRWKRRADQVGHFRRWLVAFSVRRSGQWVSPSATRTPSLRSALRHGSTCIQYRTLIDVAVRRYWPTPLASNWSNQVKPSKNPVKLEQYMVLHTSNQFQCQYNTV